MSKVIAVIAVLMTLLAILVIYFAPEAAATEKVGVVVTIPPQAEFVESVGGEKVDVTIMVPPGQDPHTYAPTLNKLIAVKQAKLYIKVGSGVEFELVHMDKIIGANENMLVVDCSEGVELIEMEDYEHEEDNHPGGNDPHIWLSPMNAKIMVENICQGLIQVDSQNREYYIQNKNEYLAKLEALDEDIDSGMAGIINRRFMVFHPAWGYFARDYNLTQMAIQIEGKTPSVSDVANLIEEAKEYNIKVVFASPQYDVKSAKTIAEAIGGTVLFIDALARDYINNMYQVLGELVQGME